VDLAYSTALYDAVMLYALAATAVMSEGGDLQDGKAMTAAMRATSFEGAAGTRVALDGNGDRIESYEVMSYVLQPGDVMRSVAVGVYMGAEQQYREYGEAVVWPGGTTEVPSDYALDRPIHLALLMPFSGTWEGGRRLAGAAALAVERVNSNKALLRGQRLEYSWADSGCSPQQGLKALGELLGKAGTVDAVIGPGCSSACEVTSYLAGGQGLPQISYSCAAASLSNKGKHPLVMPLPSPSVLLCSLLCRLHVPLLECTD
jgi:ABC-type branched-subunit amino acid transport system substrate-binding protein